MNKKFTELSVEKMAPRRASGLRLSTPGLAIHITEAGNCRALRQMTLGANPLIDVKRAREKSWVALDLTDQDDDPPGQRKDEVRQKGQRVFQAICARFIELHAKANMVKRPIR